MVTLIKHDLEFILKQIKIAEAHAKGTALTQIRVDAQGNVVKVGDPGYATATLAISDPHAPYGLRTVDGSYNNLVPGRELWGASGQPFPGVLNTNFLADTDNEVFSPGGPTITNNDYGLPGNVVDSDPRTISNLIVDQTLANPAAIIAGLERSGVPGGELLSKLAEISQAYNATKPLIDAAKTAVAQAKAALGAAGEGADLPALEQAVTDAEGALVIARQPLLAVLDANGIEMDGENVLLPNVAPDEGLSSPFNGWFTIFGQFFDHGLDLVAKGGNGTVYVPLQPDDPLYVEGSPFNFMALTRATASAGPDGIMGTPDDIRPVNMTTPWVDQNQTYGSTASKQVFMREYVAGPDGKPVATGLLLEGAKGGLATWADIKTQARELLGIDLTDAWVTKIPLIASDEYGRFIPGANGYPQLVIGLGTDGKLGTADDVLWEGDPSANGGRGVTIPATAVLTGHAFLDDIAHNADPTSVYDFDGDPTTRGDNATPVQADGDSDTGNAIPTDYQGRKIAYDDELLDAHFITGDGRGNENIALTAVHHVFHSEHNRIVQMTKDLALESRDLAFLNEWLLVDLPAGTAIPAKGSAGYAAFVASLTWDGERLFQAGRFTTEMEYQHLVFEEFGRKVQPDIDAFVFNASTDINPNIAAEFAHVVYRFGHSMLMGDVARINVDANGTPIRDAEGNTVGDIDLISAFLNPVAFDQGYGSADEAAGAIIRGMTRQVGNEIDEFVTNTLRNNVLGLPLDLATINLARGRETGTPSLNSARQTFYDATADSQLKPYDSWTDFALNLKNPASVINFIAAYGTHDLIEAETTLIGKRAIATAIVLNQAVTVTIGGVERTFDVPADRLAFLNATGGYKGGDLGGLNLVDFWIGGLAEKKMAFGGMLGSTFSFVFEMTMEQLQNGDRFYYLSRVQGLNLLNELENNSFAKLVMNNTDLGNAGATSLPGDVFSAFELPTLEMDISKQLGADPVHDNPFLQALEPLVLRKDEDGDGRYEYIKVNSNEHFTIGGTEGDDIIIAGGGDDTVWGRGGNDRIEAGYGVDKIHGGDGDDIITNSGTDIGETDFLHGDAGDDVIHGGSGLALLFGGSGNDVLIAGPDGKEIFGGTGDDFILGGEGADFLLGNEGDDWIEGGGGFDTTAGDNSELFFNSTILGHDVMFAGTDEHDFDAESGDDIMVQGESVMRNEGMLGYDWSIYKGNKLDANADLTTPIFTTDVQDILRNRFDAVEGLSGWNGNDVLKGDNRGDTSDGEVEGNPGLAGAENTMVGHELSQAGVNRIAGLRELLGDWVAAAPTGAGIDLEKIVAFDDGNILLGGGGSDTITGRGGNDLIDGDAWLNVRIGIYNTDGVEIATADSLTSTVTVAGKTGVLATLLVDGHVKPSQMKIIREIIKDDGIGDIDTAVFWDVRANYTVTRSADGSMLVSHTGFDADTAPAGAVSDGVDKLRNIERLQFADQTVMLTPPVLSLRSTAGEYADNFNARSWGNSTGGTNWGPDWVETNDDGGIATGQIRIDAGTGQGSNSLQFVGGNGANGAEITRAVDLSGVASAVLAFSANPDSMEAGETVQAQFAADGVNYVTLTTITGNGGNINHSFNLQGPFSANASIRFVGSGMNETNDVVTIDNLTIDFVKPLAANYQGTFTEGANDIDIAQNPTIVEDSGEILSARIVLTNASAGDRFNIPNNLPGNINSAVTTVGGQIIVNLTGRETLANYQAAIQTIQFENTSQNPVAGNRVIHVTVNDGFLDSNVAVATVTVVPVNDRPNAVNDTVYSNHASNTAFVIPSWALLANDSDVDGNQLRISAVTENSGNFTAVRTAAGDVQVNHSGNTTGNQPSFTYTVTDDTGTSNATDTASVTVSRVAGNITGNGSANILTGDAAGSTFTGGGGNDIIFAGGGNDRIVWNANATGNTDGYDYVDGGAGTDTFVVTTRQNTSELYRVYTVAAAVAGPNAIAGLTEVMLKPGTEIIITRTTGGAAVTTASIIAELANVEEIRIGTQTSDPTNGSAGPGDTVAIFGDFTTTSLALNTITIDGNTGDDIVDISALSSAHRIVFRSNGGNDTIVGTMRPQDVIELPDGADPSEYITTTDANGVSTMTNGVHSITFTAGSAPTDDDDDDDCDDDDDDNHIPGGGGDDDDDNDDIPVVPVDTDPGNPAGSKVGTPGSDVLVGDGSDDTLVGFAGDDVLIGYAGNDIILGGDGHDFIAGWDGRDIIWGGSGNDTAFGGAGNDVIDGEDGDDHLFGDAGNDMVTGGAGNDTVVGGAGDDWFVARSGDGDDVYFGDEINDATGTPGIDTLDMSTIMANAKIDLGTGLGGMGSAYSAQTGTDTLWGIENVVTGSGNDTIKASTAVNVMDGGSGNDTFVFLSAAHANGDTILGFEAGDKIDLSAIDAHGGLAGNQAFTLVTNGAITAPAQIAITHETIDGHDYTVVSGNTAGNDNAEFKIKIDGIHDLTASNFIL